MAAANDEDGSNGPITSAALDENGPVTQQLIDIVSFAASDRWLDFGMALLRGSTADVMNVTSALASPNPLSPKNKLLKILEEWISIGEKIDADPDQLQRAKSVSRTMLKKACEDEKILGGVNRLLKDNYRLDQENEWETEEPLHSNNSLLRAVAEGGSSKWRNFGSRLLGWPRVEIDNLCGEAGISDSDRVRAIIDHWLQQQEHHETTIGHLLSVCDKVNIKGRVDIQLEKRSCVPRREEGTAAIDIR